MYDKIKNSLQLFKACFVVFRKNKRLLVFPALNILPALIIVAFFLMPLFSDHIVSEVSAAGTHSWSFDGEQFWASFEEDMNSIITTLSNYSFVVFLLIYLAMMFFISYINVAFFSEILKAINGNPVRITRGFQTANSKIKAILLWSLVTGIIGAIIRTLTEQFDFIGRWMMGLVGIAWSVVTVFAIPVLIREENQTNPLNYLKYSARLIKKTWGEGVIGVLAINLFTRVLIYSLLLISVTIGIVVGITASPAYGVLSGAGGFVIVLIIGLIISYLQSLMTDIFRCTLYVYATEGVVPEAFEEDMLVNSFKQK